MNTYPVRYMTHIGCAVVVKANAVARTMKGRAFIARGGRSLMLECIR